jgi:hypothetical protein
VIGYRYLPSAREELNEAAARYEALVPGLGDAFLDDVERAVETVRESPGIGVATQRKFRKMILRRFPFSIVYVECGEEIVIVAVAHQCRRPGYWRRRQ